MKFHTRTQPAGRRRVRAFTLVELLIVIAIVAVLAALSLAAFKNMRQKAQAATCAGNLRQIGALTEIYAIDHNDEFPPAWNDGSSFWLDKLIAETQFNGDYTQAHLSMRTDLSCGHCPVRLRTSEAYSATFKAVYSAVGSRDGGNWWFNYGMKYVYLTPPATPAAGGRPVALRRNAVKTPSQCIYVADSNIEVGGQPRDINRGWSDAYPAARHGGRCNVLWVDGHISSETQAWLIAPDQFKNWVP